MKSQKNEVFFLLNTLYHFFANLEYVMADNQVRTIADNYLTNVNNDCW